VKTLLIKQGWDELGKSGPKNFFILYTPNKIQTTTTTKTKIYCKCSKSQYFSPSPPHTKSPHTHILREEGMPKVQKALDTKSN